MTLWRTLPARTMADKAGRVTFSGVVWLAVEGGFCRGEDTWLAGVISGNDEPLSTDTLDCDRSLWGWAGLDNAACSSAS